MTADDIATTVKNYMKRQGITQELMAEALDTNQPAISRYLSQKNTNIQVARLICMLDELNLELHIRRKR